MRKGTTFHSGNPWIITTSSLPSSRDQAKLLPTLGRNRTCIPYDLWNDKHQWWRQWAPCLDSHPANYNKGLSLQWERMDHSQGKVIWQEWCQLKYLSNTYHIQLSPRIPGYANYRVKLRAPLTFQQYTLNFRLLIFLFWNSIVSSSLTGEQLSQRSSQPSSRLWITSYLRTRPSNARSSTLSSWTLFQVHPQHRCSKVRVLLLLTWRGVLSFL